MTALEKEYAGVLENAAAFSRWSDRTITLLGDAYPSQLLSVADDFQGAHIKGNDVVVLLDGRYGLKFNEEKLLSCLGEIAADLITVTISPHLKAGRELVRLTTGNYVAGFRRLYEDTIEPAVLDEWPHLIFCHPKSLSLLVQNRGWDADVQEFKRAVHIMGLTTLHLQAAGQVMDPLYFDGVDAQLNSGLKAVKHPRTRQRLPSSEESAGFRVHSLLSYARFGKRLFDLLLSSCILLVIFPLLLAITILVKLTSRGPVFYRARRQGLHGRAFDCLKFRTMVERADKMQDLLRTVNQVDGPQFKIANDPRISGIGKFLRDTCIDELPQFFNVLAGQMSIVGPRPSPVSENESCPSWRDARLSVRPGITGLWQVCRTRRNSMDFQEWVYYDTSYIKNLSFGMDLRICLKTAQKLIGNFLDQFG